jgi:Skp family chaperone for outer membrane proteins
MKHAFFSLCLAIIICSVGSAKAETLYVVETTDLQKKSTYDVMNSEKLHELQKTVAAEARVFQKAIETVRKSWENVDKPAPGEKPADKQVRAPAAPFPSGTLSFRRIDVKGEYADEKSADKKKALLERLAADEQKKADDADKKKMDANKDKKKQDAKKAKEQELLSATQQVAVLLQTKIDELVKAAAAPGGDAAASTDTAAPAATPPAGGAGDNKPAAGAAKK